MDLNEVLRLWNEDGTEDVHYPLDYEILPEESRQYSKQVLNETDENREKGLLELKDYIKRKNLPCPDELYLLSVLRSQKFNLDKSKTKLMKSLKARRLLFSKLSQMEMEKIECIVDDLVFAVLPYRDKNGRTIIYTRPFPDYIKYTTDEAFTCGLVLVLFCMYSPMTTVHGYDYLADSELNGKLPLNHVYPATKSFTKFLPIILDMPFRIDRVDLLHEHFLTRWVLCILRPFLPEKISKRLTVFGSDHKKIHKIFHPDILPEDLSGNLGAVNNEFYREKLLNFIKKIREENQ